MSTNRVNKEEGPCLAQGIPNSLPLPDELKTEAQN